MSACSDDDTGGSSTTDAAGTADTGVADADERPDASAADTGDPDTGDDPTDADNVDAPNADDANDLADTDTDEDTAGDPDTGPLPVDAGHTGCTYPAVEGAGCSPAAFGDYGPASFINQFVIADNGQCCADFDDDGIPDSALGQLASAMEPLLEVPFNDIIDALIQQGSLIYVIEYAYFDNELNDDAVQLDMVFGQDAQPDFADNLAGTGEFLIDSASLDENGEPKSDFPTATVTDARLSVAGGSAPLVLPVNSLLVEIGVDQLSINADVAADANLYTGGTVALTNGEIAGIVPLSEMFGGLNDVARDCDCIDTDPLFVESSADQWTCNPSSDDAYACQHTPNATQLCQVLATKSGFASCTTAADLVTSQADLNTDQDAANDALSVGATFTAVGASVTGVTTP